MVAVIVLRELIITGLRSFMETAGSKFGADWLGKFKMGLQCAALIAIFSMLLLRPSRPARAAVPDWACLGLIYATVIATVLSGLQYVWRAIVPVQDGAGDVTRRGIAVTTGDHDFGFAIVGCRHDRPLPRPRPGGGSRRPHRRSGQPQPRQRPQARRRSRPRLPDLSRTCRAALARPDVHAVIVTTPSGAHLEPAVAAAERRQARRRREAAGDHGRALRPHHRGVRPQRRASSAPSSRRASATPTGR